MMGRLRSTRTPILLAGAVIAIVLGAAVAFALSGDEEDEPATPTPTVTATTTAVTATATPEAPTATAVPATAIPTAPPQTTEVWSIDFQRSGGFAGLSQSLSISSDGSARYEDMRTGTVETGTLSAETLAELRALIESSAFFSQAPEQDAPCADCFNLGITVTFDGESHTVTAIDIAVDAALEPFVARLASLLQEGLTQ